MLCGPCRIRQLQSTWIQRVGLQELVELSHDQLQWTTVRTYALTNNDLASHIVVLYETIGLWIPKP